MFQPSDTLMLKPSVPVPRNRFGRALFHQKGDPCVDVGLQRGHSVNIRDYLYRTEVDIKTSDIEPKRVESDIMSDI